MLRVVHEGVHVGDEEVVVHEEFVGEDFVSSPTLACVQVVCKCNGALGLGCVYNDDAQLGDPAVEI